MKMFKEIENVLILKSLRKTMLLVFVFVMPGALLTSGLVTISSLLRKSGFLNTFLNNISNLVFLIGISLAYMAVYKMLNEDNSIWQCIKDVVKKFHYIAGFIIVLAVSALILAAVESLLSAIGLIPYAGPFFVVLFTVPFYTVNLAWIIIFICVNYLMPPMVAEGKNYKIIIAELFQLIRTKWMSVMLFIPVSVVFISALAVVIYFVSSYAGGITKASQWNIQPLYTQMFNLITGNSSFADMICSITPGTVTLAGRTGLKLLMGLSYGIIYSVFLSFLIALYLHISSLFYKNIKE